MPSAVPIFLKKADEKQVIYFTWPNNKDSILNNQKFRNKLNINRLLCGISGLFRYSWPGTLPVGTYLSRQLFIQNP